MTLNNKTDDMNLRSRAVEFLQDRATVDLMPQSVREAQRVLHELRVYQIELELQNEELRHSRAQTESLLTRYTDLYDFAPVGYFTLKQTGEISQTNLAGARLLNMNRALVNGHRFEMFVSKADRGSFKAFLQQAFVAEYRQTCELTLEVENLSPKQVQIEAAFPADISECRIAVIDITDAVARKSAEAALISANKIAEAADIANKAKSEFLANMSHEIRNPMNATINLIQLSLKEQDDKKQHHYLEKALESSELLLSLINDILDFSKIEAGKLIIEEAPFNLSQLLKALEQIFSLQAHEKGISLKFSQDENVPVALIGDALRLIQILINLISNAVKFTKQGLIEVHTQLLDQRDSDSVVLQFSIKDTGIGIAEEKIESLFQAFTQAETSITREFGGSGLGLSISRKLVALLGGKLNAEAKLGQGSCFYFSVPFKLINQHPILAIKELNSLPHDEILTGKKLLIVDDNEINRLVLRAILEQGKMTCDEAKNGQQALEMLKNNHYDAILMDVLMPVMDGIETTKKIRQSNESYKNIPIIALTACAISGDKEKFLAAGMNAYIYKAIDVDKFLITLAELVKSEENAAI